MRTGPPDSWRPALAAALLAPAVHIVRFGYGFGFSDQDEFLPWLLHRMEPSLLSTDWFVGVQESGFNVRSGFLAILEPLAAWMGAEPAVAVLYGVAWLVLGLAVYDLVCGLAGSPAASVIGAVSILAVLPRWTVGGNALVHAMLVPSMLAWSLGIGALALHVRDRRVAPGLLLGAAAWMQPIVAFTIGLPLAVAGVVRSTAVASTLSTTIRDALRVIVPAIVVVLPLGALFWLSRTSPVPPGVEPGYLDLMAGLRAPHHFLPSSFPPGDWLRASILAVAGLSGFAAWKRAAPAYRVRYVGSFLATVALFVSAGLIAIAVPELALAQPFKTTVLSGMLFQALALAGLLSLLRARGSRLLVLPDRLASGPAAPIVAAGVLAAAVLTVPVATPPDADLMRAADMFRSRPDARETVAVPPSSTGFRYRSGRGVVVTFKTVPFSPADALAWHRRLNDIAPGATLPRALATAPLLGELDAAYEGLTAERLDEIADRYGVSWVVRRTAIPPGPAGWILEGRYGTVLVYRRDREARQ